jgi:hypothetical protein
MSFLPFILATWRGLSQLPEVIKLQPLSPCRILVKLKKDYGSEQADVIAGIVGNTISGQVTGDTAKKLSENFGKIMQDRRSISINSSDTSISKSTQMEYAIPASKIASLSSGEFVGRVAAAMTRRLN